MDLLDLSLYVGDLLFGVDGFVYIILSYCLSLNYLEDEYSFL